MAPSFLEDIAIGAGVLGIAAASLAAPIAAPVFAAEAATALTFFETGELIGATAGVVATPSALATASAATPFFEAGFLAAPGSLLTAGAVSKSLHDPNMSATQSTSNKASTSGTDERSNGLSSNPNGTKDYTPDILGTQGIRYHDPEVKIRSVVQPSGLLALPFSFVAGTFKKTGQVFTTRITCSVERATAFKDLIKQFRFAMLAHAEAVIMPTDLISLAATQVDVAWTSDDTADLSSAEMLGRLAHTRALWLPAVATPSNLVVPAPLHNLNAVVKDSIAYNDTPKVHAVMSAYNSGGIPDQAVVADFVVRGTVWVSAPALY